MLFHAGLVQKGFFFGKGGGGGGGCGRLSSFWTFRVGAYSKEDAYQLFGLSRWALIRRWAVNRINAVYEVTPTVATYYIVKTNESTDDYNKVKVMITVKSRGHLFSDHPLLSALLSKLHAQAPLYIVSTGFTAPLDFIVFMILIASIAGISGGRICAVHLWFLCLTQSLLLERLLTH